LHLRHVRLEFFAPNMTSKVQPMDQGIIQSAKMQYRRKLVHWLLDNYLAGRGIGKPNVRQGIQWLAESWDEMKATTVVNCWRHADILPRPTHREQSDEESEEGMAIIAETLTGSEIREADGDDEFANGVADLSKMLETLGVQVSAQDYVFNSHREEIAPYMSKNEDILDALVGTAEDEDDDDDVADVVALDAARELVKYFRRKDGDSSKVDELRLGDILKRLEKLQ
jgi:DDE superfamily endonuclease